MSAPLAKASVEKLKSYKPNFGKTIKKNLIRLSANESALGTSLDAVKVLNEYASNLNRYPPQVSEDLINSIANRYSLNKNKIISKFASEVFFRRFQRVRLANLGP